MTRNSYWPMAFDTNVWSMVGLMASLNFIYQSSESEFPFLIYQISELPGEMNAIRKTLISLKSFLRQTEI